MTDPAEPLVTTEHPVATKLRREILPWLISARRLRSQWFYWLHETFGYTTDGLAALAAVGLVPAAVAKLVAAGEASPGASTGVAAAAFTGVSPTLAFLFSLVLGVWVLLRVVFARQEGQKRAVLAKSCARTLRAAHAELYKILIEPDPMPAINKLYVDRIWPTVDRTMQEDGWTFTGFAGGIEVEVENELAQLCQRFASGWREVPHAALRMPREIPG